MAAAAPLQLWRQLPAAAAPAAELATAPPGPARESVDVDLIGAKDGKDEGGCGRWLFARRASGFSGAPCGLLSASVTVVHSAAVTVRGAVSAVFHSAGYGVLLPWAAAAVSCGIYDDLGGWNSAFCVAVRRGGRAACIWSWQLTGPAEDYDSSDGDHPRIEAVRGLPPSDPIAAVEAGDGFALAVTASGAVYSWAPARSAYQENPCGPDRVAVREAKLSERRIRRIACGDAAVLAETEGGELLLWDPAEELPLSVVPTDGAAAFPLRCIAAANTVFMFVDAVGLLWTVTAGKEVDGRSTWTSFALEPVVLPEGRRAVRVAAAAGSWSILMLVALTACGELWDCSRHSDAGCVSAQRLELPLGLRPFGGCTADHILLLPDCSCGKPRLRLFARIAVRLGLPSDPLRAVLVRCAVDGCYITGPEHDPFSRHYEPRAPTENPDASPDGAER